MTAQNFDLLTKVEDGEIVRRSGSTLTGISTEALAALIEGAGIAYPETEGTPGQVLGIVSLTPLVVGWVDPGGGVTSYNDLTDKPTLGTAAAASTDDFDPAGAAAAAQAAAIAAISASYVVPYTLSGTLEVGSGLAGVPILADCTMTAYRFKGFTAPTGASVILDWMRNGVSLFGTPGDRPTIAAGTTTSTLTLPNDVSLSAGDWLSLDVVQVGSTEPGADFVGAVLLTEV